MYMNRKIMTPLPAAREMLAQRELAIAVGDRTITIIWQVTIQVNALGSFFLTNKNVIAISDDIIKMNQKELADCVTVASIP